MDFHPVFVRDRWSVLAPRGGPCAVKAGATAPFWGSIEHSDWPDTLNAAANGVRPLKSAFDRRVIPRSMQAWIAFLGRHEHTLHLGKRELGPEMANAMSSMSLSPPLVF